MVSDESQRRAAADQLRAGARGYASGAAEALLEAAPEINDRFGSGGFAMWHGFLTQRVAELATAVELDEPSLFAGEVEWLFSSLPERAVSMDHVRLAIECLGAALEEELPSRSWPLVEAAFSQGAAIERAPDQADSRVCGDDALAQLGRTFLRAALDGDSSRCVAIALDGFREGVAPGSLYERVILPAQAEIGTLWQLGKIGIADEHIATELIRATMTVLWHEATGGVVSGPAVVVGSVTGDQHDTGVRAVAQVLDISGLRGICLGCDVPAEEFAVAANRFSATAAIVSASMSVHLPRVKQTVALLLGAVPGLRVLVGGPAFGMDPAMGARLAEKMGSHGFAATPTAAASLVK